MTEPAPSVEAAAIGPRPSWLRRHAAKLGASVLLGSALAWLLARGGLPLVPPRAAFDALAWWALPVFAALTLASHALRAVRFRHLLRPLGEIPLLCLVAISWISFCAILVAPLRTGEVVRPYLVAKRGTVRLWEATGAIGAERVIDGLALSLVLLAGLSLSKPIEPLPDRVGDLRVPAAAVPGAAYASVAIFGGAFAVMALFFWHRELARRAVRATLGLVSPRLADAASSIAQRLAEGLRFLPSLRHLGPFLAETAGYWGALVLGTWALARGTGLDDATLAEAAVTLGCTGIGILVPAGPGFFGAFQLASFMALAMFFPEETLKSRGAAFVFLYYAVQVVINLLAAAAGLVLDRRSPDCPSRP
jgi:hypothetical protein